MAMEYTNPVIAGFAPDPSICRVGDDFYLANSSFTMVPGLPIYHSRDLAHWDLIGYALSYGRKFSVLGSDTNGGIFAPTLRYHDGVFHVIVKDVSNGRNWLLTTRDPAGQWDGPRAIGPDWDGDIDPDLFFDLDGTAYVARRIGKPGPEGEHGGAAEQFAWRFDVARARVTSEKIPLWNGTGKLVWPEGGHLYRRGDFYYYLLAEGGTSLQHRVTIARRAVGRGLDDPALATHDAWTPCPHNPILFNDPVLKPDISSTGHADLVDDAAGHSWAVFVGERRGKMPLLGRETFLAPVEWREGWPIVNGGKAITAEMQLDAPLPGGDRLPTSAPATIPVTTRDDFEQEALGLEWNVLRTLEPERHSLATRKGWLTLTGTANNLTSTGLVAWVGRRLRHHTIRLSTRVDARGLGEDHVAGLSVLARIDSHVELLLRKTASGAEIIVRVNSATVLATGSAETSVIDLRLEIERGQIRFLSAIEADAWQLLHEMALEKAIGAPGFAGLYVGVGVIGEGATAAFDFVEDEPL